ncbi:MAG: hypothetical protein IJY04_05375, partial [Clostridia bacterium]|nr:hypothetical protein [Clostridia bacterium]
TLVEDILTVDADGDILFYNQIIGNTAETAKIEIAIDEDKMILDAYVNGELIATGFYANADYYNVDDQVYLAAFRLVSVNGGEYGVDSFNIYTGYYGEE